MVQICKYTSFQLRLALLLEARRLWVNNSSWTTRNPDILGIWLLNDQGCCSVKLICIHDQSVSSTHRSPTYFSLLQATSFCMLLLWYLWRTWKRRINVGGRNHRSILLYILWFLKVKVILIRHNFSFPFSGIIRSICQMFLYIFMHQ